MTNKNNGYLDKEIKGMLKSYAYGHISLKDFTDYFGDYPADDFFGAYLGALAEVQDEIEKEKNGKPIKNRFEILDL